MRKKIFLMSFFLIFVTIGIQLFFQFKKKINISIEENSYKDESHLNEKKKIFGRM